MNVAFDTADRVPQGGPPSPARATSPRQAPFDRGDLALVLALPFLAVMLVCAATTPDALATSQSDVILYFRDGARLAAGSLPYRDFGFEYPPLALVQMVLPHLLRPGATLLEYEWIWALQNALLASSVGALVTWIAARPQTGLVAPRAALAWAVVAVIEAPVIAWRFDIGAVALAVAGLALVLAARPGLAGVALGLGALVKVFPVVLVPVLVAWLLARGDRRGLVRLGLAFGAVVAVVLGTVVALVGVPPALSFVDYQADRIVQVESVAASLLLLGHLVSAAPVELVYGFQSWQVTGPGTDAFLAIQAPLMVVAVLGVAGLALLCFRGAERPTDGPAGHLPALVAYLFAAIVVLIAANKVFSAQYLLWALPIGCLLPRRQAALVVGVALLSALVFPLGYRELMRLEPQAILTLVVRNGLLVGLLGWALIRYRPARPVGLRHGGPVVAT